MRKAIGSAGSPAAALPVSVWAEILQHVPQEQRLGNSALVCRSWARAAAQATVHVQCEGPQPESIPALQSWLSVHAGHLLSLKLLTSSPSCLQLPLDKLGKLQHLHLEEMKVQLPGEGGIPASAMCAGIGHSSSSAGSSHAATRPVLASLQDLVMFKVQLANISSLLQLTKAPQLTSLALNDLGLTELGFCTGSNSSNRYPMDAVQAVTEAIPQVLQQMPKLVHLQLPGFPFSDAAVQQAAAMTQLKQIFIEHLEHTPAFDMQPLPSSIKQLQFVGDRTHDPDEPPMLPQLTGLVQLDIGCCALPARFLESATQLQMLQMLDCRLLPFAPDADLDGDSIVTFLQVLPTLVRLQDLRLELHYMDADGIAPQHFSALTASSHLTQLHMARADGMTLPKDAVQYMFPPGKQLQQLQHLTIQAILSDRPFYLRDEWCLDSQDITRAVKACPQLRSLNITNSVWSIADLSPLLHLPRCCTSLSVGGEAFADAAVPIVLQLTQLRSLEWSWSPCFTDAGLEQLTVLQLCRLCVKLCDLSDELNTVDWHGTMIVELESDTLLGSVSQQLDVMCDSSPLLAPARLKKLRATAAAREEQHQTAHKRLQEALQRSEAADLQLHQQLEAAQARQQQ